MSIIFTYLTQTQQGNKYSLASKSLIILIVLFLQVINLTAQNQSDEPEFNPNLQVGISGGTSIFFGDIKQNPVFPISDYMNEWRFAYGLNFNYNLSYVFNIRLQGLYGKLSGTNQDGKIWFENDYYELNLNTAIDFTNLFGKKRDDRLVSVIGIVGFGMMNYNTVVKRLGDYFVYKRVGYGYGTGIDGRQRQTFFMVGAGASFRINRRLNILFETVNKLPESDLIDGVESGKYYDFYNYTSIGVTYKFTFLNKQKKTKPEPEIIPIQPVNSVVPRSMILSIAIAPDYSLADQKTYNVRQQYADSAPIEPETTPQKTKAIEETTEQPIFDFRVQIRAEYAKPLSKSWLSNKFDISSEEIEENIVNEYYVYTTGSFDTYEEAFLSCKDLKEKNGAQDAFIVAFKDGERVFPAELEQAQQTVGDMEIIAKTTFDFRVQIRAEYIEPLSKSWLSEKFNIPESDIDESLVNDFYIYTTGSFDTYEDALIKCSELKEYNNVKGAFVVGFENGIRVFPAEAEQVKSTNTIEEAIKHPTFDFRVQIRAEYAKPLSISWLSDMFNIPASDIEESIVDEYYVYTTGSFNTFNEALLECTDLKENNGVEGAFVVGFEDGIRVFPSKPEQAQPTNNNKETIEQPTFDFRVQIRAEYAKPLSISALREMFDIPISEIEENIVGEFYVYTTGSFTTYDEAFKKCTELKKYKGVKGAFVVGYKNGKRVYPE